MYKRACLMAALLVLTIMYVPAMAESPDFGLAGGLGLTAMDDSFFVSTSLYPDLSIGKLGVGLELTLNINKNGIRKEDWVKWDEALARSIRYIRWSHKGDTVYVLAGQLVSSDIGSGVLVGNYTNRSASDVKNGVRTIGAVADLDLGLAGVETLVNDVQSPGLIAGRVFVRPTRLIPGQPLGRLSVGYSVARDSRVVNNGLQGEAIDVMLPLGSNLLLYAHQATLHDNSGDLGAGIGAGLRGTFGPINFIAEARKLDAGFVPTPFSKSYEDSGIRAGVPETNGYLLGANLSLGKGDLVLGVQQEFNTLNQENPRVTGSLAIKGDLLKTFTGGRDAAVSADYTKEIVVGGSNAYLKANAKIAVLRGAYLSYEYDAVISPGNVISAKSTGGIVFGAM